jgi:Tfp pilus assembly protein PilO
MTCAGLIAVSLFYSFILEPLATRWLSLNNEIRIMQLKLKKSTQTLKRRIEIMDRYENIAAYVGKPRGSDEEEMTVLLSELERLASASSARITDIKPRPPKQLDYYKKYTIEVESEGDMATLTKFIYEIQNSSQLLSIEKVSLTMKSGVGSALKTYMLVTKILP